MNVKLTSTVLLVIVVLSLATTQAADVREDAGSGSPQSIDALSAPEAGRSVTRKAEPSKSRREPATAARDVTQRAREQIYILRQHRVFCRNDVWAAAIRELAQIGKPAVPELVAELDRTNGDQTLRALGFTFRAINDPRAVYHGATPDEIGLRQVQGQPQVCHDLPECRQRRRDGQEVHRRK